MYLSTIIRSGGQGGVPLWVAYHPASCLTVSSAIATS
nr:MAG TPA: hypothetical protein [Caudoviricetes sp.]